MPTDIANTIGTQRQFSKQPVGTYQKNLINPSIDSGRTGADLNAQALVNALGVIGDGLMRESKARDTRREAYSVLVEKAVNQATPEEMEKLRSIEIINKYAPEYGAADNPYAVALVEKAKGKYLKSKVQSEYDADTNLMALEGSSEEAVRRYEDKLKEAREGMAQNSDDLFAFDSGLFDTHADDVLKIANSWRERKSAQIKQTSIETSVADAGQIALDSHTVPTEQTLDNVQKLANRIRVYGWTDKERYAFWDDVVTKIAKSSGNAELLDKLKDVVIYDDGDIVKTVGSTIDFSDKVAVAGVRTAQLRHQEFNDFIDKASQAETIEEVRQMYADLEKNPEKRVLYEGVLGYKDNLEAAVTKRLEKIKAARVSQAVGEANTSSMTSAFKAKVEAHLKGEIKAPGFGLTDIMDYAEINEKGEVKTKKMTQEQLAPMIDQYMMEILQDDDLSVTEKAEKTLQVLSHPDLKFYGKSMADKAMQQLATLNPDNLGKDDLGNYILPQGLTNMLNIRKYGGTAAPLVFDADTLGNIDALDALQDMSGFNEGVNLYVNSREKFNDKEFQSRITSALKNTEFDLSNFSTMTGEKASVSSLYNTYENARAMRQLRTLMTVGGVWSDVDKAKDAVVERMRKNYYVINGALFPKEVCKGVNPVYMQEGINLYIEKYKEDNGVPDKVPITLEWNHKSNTLELKSDYGKVVSYPISKLQNQALYVESEYRKSGNIEAVGKTSNDFGGSDFNAETYVNNDVRGD